MARARSRKRGDIVPPAMSPPRGVAQKRHSWRILGSLAAAPRFDRVGTLSPIAGDASVVVLKRRPPSCARLHAPCAGQRSRSSVSSWKAAQSLLMKNCSGALLGSSTPKHCRKVDEPHGSTAPSNTRPLRNGSSGLCRWRVWKCMPRTPAALVRGGPVIFWQCSPGRNASIRIRRTADERRVRPKSGVRHVSLRAFVSIPSRSGGRGPSSLAARASAT